MNEINFNWTMTFTAIDYECIDLQRSLATSIVMIHHPRCEGNSPCLTAQVTLEYKGVGVSQIHRVDTGFQKSAGVCPLSWALLVLSHMRAHMCDASTQARLAPLSRRLQLHACLSSRRLVPLPARNFQHSSTADTVTHESCTDKQCRQMIANNCSRGYSLTQENVLN